MKNLFSWLSDGIDMQESLALFFTLIWAGVVAVLSVKSYLFGLTDADNDFFWVASWPTIIAAAFYYGHKIAINLTNRKLSNIPVQDEITEPVPVKDWRDFV